MICNYNELYSRCHICQYCTSGQYCLLDLLCYSIYRNKWHAGDIYDLLINYLSAVTLSSIHYLGNFHWCQVSISFAGKCNECVFTSTGYHFLSWPLFIDYKPCFSIYWIYVFGKIQVFTDLNHGIFFPT